MGPLRVYHCQSAEASVSSREDHDARRAMAYHYMHVIGGVPIRNRYVLLADVAAIGCAGYGAFVLRFDWLFLSDHPEFLAFLPAALVIKPTIFFWFGLYRRYWRYATIQDLTAVLFACGAATVGMSLFIGLAVLLGSIQQFSQAGLVLDGLLTLLAVGGVRMSIRMVYEPTPRIRSGPWPFGEEDTEECNCVLVVGAGATGTMAVLEMQRNPHLKIEATAFLDADPERLIGVR